MSDPIADRLRAWLDHHHLIAGGPLPAERELAGILGCSRHQARLAVLELEAAGEVSSAVGRRRVVTGNRRGADRDWSRTVVLVAAPRDVPAPGSAPGRLSNCNLNLQPAG